MASINTQAVLNVIGDRIIFRSLRLPRSLDYTHPDVDLWRKRMMFCIWQQLPSTAGLRRNISDDIHNVQPVELVHVFSNMQRRANLFSLSALQTLSTTAIANELSISCEISIYQYFRFLIIFIIRLYGNFLTFISDLQYNNM